MTICFIYTYVNYTLLIYHQILPCMHHLFHVILPYCLLEQQMVLQSSLLLLLQLLYYFNTNYQNKYVNLFTEDGFTNNPLPGLHSKYLTPSKLPSFFPLSSSNSTPIQVPGYENNLRKAYLTICITYISNSSNSYWLTFNFN